MMNLPLNVIQNFKRVPENLVATNLSLFDKLYENDKYLSMQFLFNQTAAWKIDLSVGSPIKPLSKISNLYIDAVNCQHDVIVYFPDTGFEVHVAAGTVFLTPTLVSRGAYVFYVSLQNQVLDPSDIVNIFALNVSIPFFDSLWQYPTGKSTQSPNGTNTSTWFFAGTPNAGAFDDFENYSAVSFADPGSPVSQPIFGFESGQKFILKNINYGFNLYGVSPENPVSPPVDFKLLQVQLDIVESNLFLPDIIISTQIFTNTQNGMYTNSDYFLYHSSFNRTVRDENSYLSLTTTVLQGEFGPAYVGDYVVDFDFVFQYIT